MHELGATRTLIGVILDTCRAKGISDPSSFIVRVGQLTSYSSESLIFYFDILKKEHNVLKDTTLEVRVIDGRLRCRKCGRDFSINEPYMIYCPDCETADVELIAGREFDLTEVRVAEDV
ncbi:hydrogenase maturation nickel metallochaperone HypA [Candidatus Altiarchaeota archaeon]